MDGVAGASATGDDRARLQGALPAYLIEGKLGRGAAGVVYAARHIGLDREVAIKLLAPDLVDRAEARMRFAAEARMLGLLVHPHIVLVHDYVERDDVCALIMERLHGGSLADRMRPGPLEVSVACAVAVAAAQGLEHAHRKGVLHRDVKPENLLLGPDNVVKVADFGIAKLIRSSGARLTATAGTLGTPAYMAPEQVRGALGAIGPQTDVWSLAAVLYEMLAGAPPFPYAADADVGAVLLARVTEEPRDLGEVAPAVPGSIAAVVMRALARDPADRPATAEAFGAALAEAARTELGPEALTRTGVPMTPAGVVRPAAAETLTDPAQGSRPPGRQGLRLAAAVAAAAVVAAVAVALPGKGDDDPQAPREAAVQLPVAPTGWPAELAIGGWDPVDGAAGIARRMGEGALAYNNYGVGDAAAKKDWSHSKAAGAPSVFAREAHKAGALPYVTYYMLRALGRDGTDDATVDQLRRTLGDPRLMRIYWNNVRAFMKELGRAPGTTAVSVEPSVWALLEQQLIYSGGAPSDVGAIVGSSGAPELRDMGDNLTALVDGWHQMRDRYAPDVLLGMTLDFYGANIDISRETPTSSNLQNAARSQGRFFLQQSSAGPVFDFASFEIAFSEAGAPGAADEYSDEARSNVIAWLREFNTVTGYPVVLEAVPLGNSVMKTMDNTPYHYTDGWIQWLFADEGANLRALHEAGLVGLQFGATSPPDGTCACDAAGDGVTNGAERGRGATSADDDGGYLAEQVALMRERGGLALNVAPAN